MSFDENAPIFEGGKTLNDIVYASDDVEFAKDYYGNLLPSKVRQDKIDTAGAANKNKKRIKDMQAASATNNKTSASQVRSVLGGGSPQAQTPQSILGGSSATKTLLGI